ncbi:MAG: transketolase [Bauldia sp.]|nr:transketolase [Bauldia sp.]
MTDTNASAAQSPASGQAFDRMLAHAIRVLGIDAIESAKSGHFGVPMGMADIAAVLFGHFMKFDPTAPNWPDRDRFVLSNGHGSMLQYALLYLTGYEDMTLDQIRSFRQLGSKTAGHPEYGHATGIETTTGPLGQGLANAVGMAIAERMMNARYGDDLVDHYTYCFVGDGCLMEGISHEAIDLAGHLKLGKLIVLFDDNQISIDGPTSLTSDMDQVKRFEAAGWSVRTCDGHNADEIYAAIEAERKTDRPSFIACKTIIGLGAGAGAGTARAHGEGLTAEELAGAKQSYGWEHGHFVVPERELSAWRAIGSRGAQVRKNWERRLAQAPADRRESFEKAVAGHVGAEAEAAIAALKAKHVTEKPKIATRVASQKALEALLPVVPGLVGGSADLTGSVGTKAADIKALTPTDFTGRYIHYGIREHGMAAAMNGIALHKGLIPYAGTFLAFADYSRPSIRLGALMGIRVIHVMTHDSIGLGQDGPTHQPVEHVASLRAIPNLLVFRPADPVETAEAWLAALQHETTPSVLVLTRQAVPAVRTTDSSENLVAKGGYVLSEPEGGRQVTLLATGSELQLAVKAAETLAAEGIRAAVVSMPCFELFDAQPADYRKAVLGTAPRVAVEAAVRQSWDRYLGDEGEFIGMSGFGASGPAEKLFEHFGITADAVAGAARRLVG